MNGHAYPDTPITRDGIRSLTAALILAGLAVVALIAVLAPTANAGPDRTIKRSFTLPELNIYDPALTEACGFEVVGLVEGTIERKLTFGTAKNPAAHETQKFDGHMTWIARASGKTYSDKMENTTRIEYPQGTSDWPLPAHVTVTGSHGGTFPVGDGLPGNGKIEYEAQIYSTDDEGFPYIFVDSELTYHGHGFERATQKICAQLS